MPVSGASILMTLHFAPVSRRLLMQAHPAGEIFRPFMKPLSLVLAPESLRFLTL